MTPHVPLMKLAGSRLPFVAIAIIAGFLTAGCGSEDNLTLSSSEREAALEAKVAALESQNATSTTIDTTTTTTAPPTTTTTACVPVNTGAQTAYLHTLRASIRQTESAIDTIQLVIDNGVRDRDAAARYTAAVQADRDLAARAVEAFAGDTNRDKLAYQERRLADANGIVASWNATITKARGDLDRAKKQKADFEQKARAVSAEIAAGQGAC